MVKVYRVEDADGYGAYSDHKQFENLVDDPADGFNEELWEHWPLPSDDSALVAAGFWAFEGKYGRTGIRFCFASLDQFRAWFYKGEWRSALKADGCSLSVYELDPQYVCAGDSQAIFVAGNEKLIEKIDLESA